MTEFTKIFNECFPLLPVQIKTLNNRWYDDELKELHKNKEPLLQKVYRKQNINC